MTAQSVPYGRELKRNPLWQSFTFYGLQPVWVAMAIRIHHRGHAAEH